jgi:hypothetical protein
MAEIAIGDLLQRARERLEQAARVAQAAGACAETGNSATGGRGADHPSGINPASACRA